VRADAIIATGRSDYPNQVNNVLCFPYIFRGALDVGATTINEEMKLAACARSPNWRRPSSRRRGARLRRREPAFGPEYLIPKPFDPRLIVRSRRRWPRPRWIRRGDAADRRLRRLPRALQTSSSTTPA
jgi:malate dehydrogenase (oxaloacetate-decarboxylating)(NADP+)